MKIRVIYNNDKSVAVISPINSSKRPDETDAQWLDRVFSKATPEKTDFEDMDDSQLPKDRRFRNAWEGEKGKGITINQDKANKIALKEKIGVAIKQVAIDYLKNKGELPANYTE